MQSNSPLPGRVAAARLERANAGLLRRVKTARRFADRRLQTAQGELIDFASNDYLGLSQEHTVVEAMVAAAREYGSGAGAAHLLGGHHPLHQQLSEQLADWLGRDKVLLFATGYMANLGTIAGLLERGDICIQDKLNHASLIDAARLSGAELKRYPHADLAAAERRLAQSEGRVSMLITDGVFSMDGDVAPLTDLAKLCQRYGSVLMVDDAHGLGVCGEQGRGSCADLSSQQLPLLMGTLGKAFGQSGAFVAADGHWIDHLTQSARPFVYSTAPPPPVAAANLAALAIIRDQPQRRQRLQDNIAHFRRLATQVGIELQDVHGPIQPLMIGDASQALKLATRLGDAGFYVPAIRPPTVPAGSARLRVTLSAAHSRQQIEALLGALETVHAH
ncbi:MAG: 8-amino-7-oxononanoate synthase [Lysobacteraceae bacterium]|nr:MAG: 8-amino-7-oxononanoate synthase [Xanthomonadaceae bacterium]